MGIDTSQPEDHNSSVRVFRNRDLGLLREKPLSASPALGILRDSCQMPRVKSVRRRASAASTLNPEEHAVFCCCRTLSLYSVPALGKIVSSSTVLSVGTKSAFTTACATVFGDIIFFRGASGQKVFQIAVSVAPGRSAITRMPCPRSSSLRVFVNPSAPCLEALYADEPGKTLFAATERLFTIAPPRFMRGNAARVTRNMPVRLVSMTSIHESTGNFATLRLG
jgi:hypothetical protein